MIKIISYLCLKFKMYFFCFMKNYKDNLCINNESYDLVESQKTCKFRQFNYQIRSNTSPNLQILQNPKQMNCFCKTCNKQISKHSNIYCCNDYIFCTPNCRDRFLNYL